MQFPAAFDARQIEPNVPFEAIPAGWYIAQVTGSALKPTRDNTGAYLEFELTIIDGQYKGRKLYDRMNVQNSNPVAVEIGFRSLSGLCRAVNRLVITQSEELHGIPCKVKVSHRPAEGQYEASNEVKGYEDVNSQKGATPAPAAPFASPAVAPAAGAAAPWAQPAAPAPAPAPAPAAPPAGGWAPPAPTQAQPAPSPGGWTPPAAPQPWQQPGQPAAPAPAPAAPAPAGWGAPAAAGAPALQPAPAAGAKPPWA